ncbi:MAG: 16S rRNA (guanine(966)-N(2))-methyltransferase RsmD [Actinomycetes bacterium]
MSAGRGPRVIAGEIGGLRLATPRGSRTRPTSDRVKESLFAALGARIDAANVLDLYAGSGALAIEALSRGATRAVAVDADAAAVAAIRTNVVRGHLEGRLRVHARPVAPYLSGAAEDGPFDLVLMDPPYDTPDATIGAHLVALGAPGVLAEGACVVVERAADGAPTMPTGWRVTWSRTYGDTLIVLCEPGGD